MEGSGIIEDFAVLKLVMIRRCFTKDDLTNEAGEIGSAEVGFDSVHVHVEGAFDIIWIDGVGGVFVWYVECIVFIDHVRGFRFELVD